MVATQLAVRQPGTGTRVLWLGDTLIEVLLDSAATGGQLSVLRLEAVGVGSGAPPHTHTNEDEVFIVLEGTVTFTCDGADATIGAGGSVFLPRGLCHAYRLDTPRAVLLMAFTPAGMENMFLEGGEPATAATMPHPPAGPPSPNMIAELVALTARYGCTLAATGNHN